MLGMQYDLEKLDSSGKFDTTMAMWLHYDKQSYYDALTHFVHNFDADLRNYTPAFVVHEEDDRNRFLNECYGIRAELMRLGMSALMHELSVMEDAARNTDVKEFADGQVKMVATLELCKRLIAESAKKWRLDPKATKAA